MKFLLIGHSVVDIIKEKNKTTKKPGGIFYSTLALNNLIDENDEIYLCTSIDKENYYLFEEVYSSLNSKYIQEVEKIPVVHLNIYDDKEREEKYENITSNLKTDFDNINQFDAILINMITGYDIELDQLQKIRNDFKGKIYFDVHTLSRGLTDSGKREFRKIPDFEKWSDCIDIIQTNENEVKTLTEFDDELKTAIKILNSSDKFVIVTKQQKGSRVYFREKDEIESVFISAEKVDVKNKVSPGDVFGAAFVYNYFKYKDLIKTLKFANITAGISAGYENYNDYENLKNDVTGKFN